MTLPTTGTNLLSDTFSGNIAITGNATVTGNETVSGNVTVGGDLIPSSSFLRNRIINGAMVIDQRNAGAAINSAATASYAVDRFVYYATQSGKFNLQQNAGSVTLPAGFTNYLGATSTSAYSSAASDVFVFAQKIEGFNVADLAWGTASAKTITLSFLVYSSLTGTFSGSLQNSAQTRGYPFTFTVSSANTWTNVSVTIAGDTSGTWVTNNGVGLIVNWDLGNGSTYRGTAGAWATANYLGATGSVSVVGTNGATFYITGVQLEVGSNATPFERRQYGEELMLCQRYYTSFKSNSNYTPYGVGHGITTTSFRVMMNLPVSMRAAQTISTTGTFIWSFGNAATPASLAAYSANTVSFDCVTTGLSAFGSYMLTDAGSNNSSINLSAEL